MKIKRFRSLVDPNRSSRSGRDLIEITTQVPINTLPLKQPNNNNQTMAFLSPTKVLLKQARVLLVGSGRMGNIRAKAIFSNPRFEFVGVIDENINGARQLADVYRVRFEFTRHWHRGRMIDRSIH